jgi:hypothetical protein
MKRKIIISPNNSITRLDHAPFYSEKCMGLDSTSASGLSQPLPPAQARTQKELKAKSGQNRIRVLRCPLFQFRIQAQAPPL